MQRKASLDSAYPLLFAVMGGVAVGIGIMAAVLDDAMAAMAIAIIGLYVVHLATVRMLLRAVKPENRQGSPGIDHAAKRASTTDGLRSVAAAPGGAHVVSSRPSEQAGSREVEPEPEPAASQVVVIPTTEDSDWMLTLPDSGAAPVFYHEDGHQHSEAAETAPDPLRAAAEGSVGGEATRKFTLGTVAIIRGALDPAQVALVLERQRKFPRKRFGELAVEMNFIEEADLMALLEAQRVGVFSNAEILQARTRLAAFRQGRSSATA